MADCPGNNELNGSPREALKKLLGQTVCVTAVFEKEGSKRCKHSRATSKETVVIKNIRDIESREILAGHLWFNKGNTWKKLKLRKGDMIELTARCKEYRKGYWGPSALRRRLNPPSIDYGLTAPKEIRVISRSHLSNPRKRDVNRDVMDLVSSPFISASEVL